MEEFLLALAKELAVPVIFGIASIYLILVSDTGRWGNGELSLSTKTILNYLGWILFSIFLFMMGLASVPIVDKFFGNPRYSLGFFELLFLLASLFIVKFITNGSPLKNMSRCKKLLRNLRRNLTTFTRA